MNRAPIIRITETVDSITVEPGQVLTVWLNTEPGGRKCVQVELRVKSDGTPEIFTDTDKLKTEDFAAWRDFA